MSLVFLDTETTGLDPKLHEVFEIAYVVDNAEYIECEIVAHTLRNATEEALTINRYHKRRVPELFTEFAARRFESRLFTALEGQTLVCANPHFDANMLEARWGAAPWHYRLLDIEAYAMPAFGWDTPKGLHTIYTALNERGFNIPESNHTAWSDVNTLRETFWALRGIYATNAVKWTL